jgi:hypothetical protein
MDGHGMPEAAGLLDLSRSPVAVTFLGHRTDAV